jgi:hypothetical protein
MFQVLTTVANKETTKINKTKDISSKIIQNHIRIPNQKDLQSRVPTEIPNCTSINIPQMLYNINGSQTEVISGVATIRSLDVAMMGLGADNIFPIELFDVLAIFVIR